MYPCHRTFRNQGLAAAVLALAGAVLLPAQDALGSLSIRALDEAGAPVAGLALQLLPPVSSGPPFGRRWASFRPVDLAAPGVRGYPENVVAQHDDIVWQATTDAAGSARFVALPAAMGYRIGVLRAAAVEITPAHEHSVPTWTGDGVAMRHDAPRNLSGNLEVRNGATTEVSICATAPSSVRARLPLCAERPIAGAVLFAITAHRAGPEARRVSAIREEARATIDDRGGVQVASAAPGPKVLRAFWYDSPRSVRFASVELSLAAGETRDLGALRPLNLGGDIALQVDVAQGDGDPLEPLQVYRDTRAAHAVVLVSAGRNGPHWGHNVIIVPVGEPLLLRGLPRGDANVSSVPYRLRPASLQTPFHSIRPSPERELILGEDVAQVELLLTAVPR